MHSMVLRTGAIMAGAAAITFPGHALAQPTGKLTLYGFTQGDMTYDANRVDPSWEDALRPTKIATTPGQFGSNGQTTFSAKQSRFGVSADIPVNDYLGSITTKFEFDLFGTGVDAGQTTIRLRHAYGELGQVLAGQTNSNFMDGEVFPNTIEYWGPPGMIFIRNPQLRWTPLRDDMDEIAIALERPSNDIDPGVIRQLDTVLGASIRNDEKLPDFSAHWNTKGGWGHFQFAGVLRYVGYDTLDTPENRPKGSRLGWGLSAGGHLNVAERDKVMTQVSYGEGISNYMNDGQTDLAPNLVPPDLIRARAVPVLGALVYYDHYWNKRWSTSLGWSITHNNNTTLQEATAFHEGQYASINLLYTPTKSFLFGVEGLWGQRVDHDGNAGQDMRAQFSMRYSFGADINI